MNSKIAIGISGSVLMLLNLAMFIINIVSSRSADKHNCTSHHGSVSIGALLIAFILTWSFTGIFIAFIDYIRRRCICISTDIQQASFLIYICVCGFITAIWSCILIRSLLTYAGCIDIIPSISILFAIMLISAAVMVFVLVYISIHHHREYTDI